MGKIDASDKIMFKNQKKTENMEIKDIFYINLYRKHRLDIHVEFTTCLGTLITKKALTSFTVYDEYR